VRNRDCISYLQVAHIMAKPVTSLLYVSNRVQDAPESDSRGAAFVWWTTKGATLHVHDVGANNTTAKSIPPDKVSPKAVVRVLVLDTSGRWVWAGHDDGRALACAISVLVSSAPAWLVAPARTAASSPCAARVRWRTRRAAFCSGVAMQGGRVRLVCLSCCLISLLTCIRSGPCRTIAVWREATNKLVCVTERALSKAIGCALCIAAVSDLVVAVAANGGRVLVLRLVDGDAAPATPVDALEQGFASSDNRKRIVVARASFTVDAWLSECPCSMLACTQLTPRSWQRLPALRIDGARRTLTRSSSAERLERLHAHSRALLYGMVISSGANTPHVTPDSGVSATRSASCPHVHILCTH
jgi:hypothetical protein